MDKASRRHSTVYLKKSNVQSVSKSQPISIDDKRGVGSERAAKGIYADNSWDRWLANYNKPRPKKPKFVPKPTTNIYIPYRQAIQEIVDEFDNFGYSSACELTQSLYSDGKISLINKSKIMNELASLQMMTSKQRKCMRKL